MKVLKIDNNSGKYSKDGISYNSIKDITREDIKYMIELILFNEQIEYDLIPEEEDKTIKNPVEKIIYENILNKIQNLIQNKSIIKSSVEKDYKDLYAKYNLDEFSKKEETE